MARLARFSTARSLLFLPIAAIAAVAACTEVTPKPLGAQEGDPPIDAGSIEDAHEEVSDAAPSKLRFEPISTGPLTRPIDVAARAGRIYVAEQAGTIRIVGADGGTGDVVIDLSARVSSGFDQGILGFAFHPKFPATPYLYVTYTAPNPTDPPPANVSFQSVVARYESHDGGLTFDPASEKRILVWDHPGVNHNNNTVVFGPDGLLYIASGDGTDPHDLYGHAQRTDDLLGKILRIDVDHGEPYAVPESNPFADGGGRAEIYAYGLRNPWRMEFDRPSGRLFAGDVGEYAYEEIDEIFSGGNYGWPAREGFACFDAGIGCDAGNFIDPLFVHDHKEATAIVGGVVYRGSAIPELSGKYVYCDAAGRYWAATMDSTAEAPTALTIPRTSTVAIRLDEAGELIIAGYSSGQVLRLVR